MFATVRLQMFKFQVDFRKFNGFVYNSRILPNLGCCAMCNAALEPLQYPQSLCWDSTMTITVTCAESLQQHTDLAQ